MAQVNRNDKEGRFLDRVLERDPAWTRGLALVVALSLLGAWLVVQAVVYWRGQERAVERTRIVQQAADALITQTTGGGLIGAVSLMGLSEPQLKDMARGYTPPDDPGSLARLAVARGRFLISGVYVMSTDGTVVAHETAGERATGSNLAFRPYFQQAMKGAISVYAAIGVNSQERGLYYAAPLYETDSPNSTIVGVV